MIGQDTIVTVMTEDRISKEYEALLFDVKYDKEQFKDNATIGLLLYRLAKERESSNAMFKQISGQLERIANLLQKGSTEQVKGIISDIDQKILAHIQRNGKVDAEEIQSIFQYRGKNAASARLNDLYEKGLLKKGRAGKKVFYWVNAGDEKQTS
jgi:predicted HTH transcriptional regulator